jgi:hypothetical protein
MITQLQIGHEIEIDQLLLDGNKMSFPMIVIRGFPD